MAGTDRLTILGFVARFAFALLVVGATYNPTGYSYYAAAKVTGGEWHPPIVRRSWPGSEGNLPAPRPALNPCFSRDHVFSSSLA